MTTQPEALRLAAIPIFERSITWQSQATIELRRLSAVEAQRDALLEALKGIVAMWDHHCYAHGDGQPTPLHAKARAAIKAVEDGK